MAVTGWKGYVFLTMLAVLSSCSGSKAVGQSAYLSEPVAQDLTNRSAIPPWTIEFNLSGGIAGRDEILFLSTDGQAKTVDRRLAKTLEKTLSVVQQEKITEILAGLEMLSADEANILVPSRCRDCPVFRLVLRTKGKPRTIMITSDRLAASPYHDLITTMIAIMGELSKSDR